MKQFQFAKYCTPAQLYLVLALIGIIAGFLKNFRVFTLITHSVFVVLFAWILNFLCRKGFTAISWVLVLLPFVLAACTYTLALDAADKKDQELFEGFQEEKDGDEDEEEEEEFIEGETTNPFGGTELQDAMASVMGAAGGD